MSGMVNNMPHDWLAPDGTGWLRLFTTRAYMVTGWRCCVPIWLIAPNRPAGIATRLGAGRWRWSSGKYFPNPKNNACMSSGKGT
jgi:hypothetical protein